MVNNIFGTDGIRNTVGITPFTVEHLTQLGQALALWAQQKYGRRPSILLAHDTRASCSLVKSALKSGLLMFPLEIHDAQILPSPAVFQIMQHQPLFSCGIIISASHNPHQDNKLLPKFPSFWKMIGCFCGTHFDINVFLLYFLPQAFLLDLCIHLD